MPGHADASVAGSSSGSEGVELSAGASRRARMLLVALIALGLTVRLAMVFVMPEGKAAPTLDAWANLQIGRSLAAGDGFALPVEPRSEEVRPEAGGPAAGAEARVSERLADRTPGYPLAVAAALRLAEQGIRLLASSQAVIGAITMALVAYLAWRLAGMWAAAAAAALLVFDPYQVYVCALALPIVVEGLVLAALAGAGLKFIDASKQGGRAWPWAALAGLFAAAAVYLDWRIAGLAVVVGVVALVAPGRRRYLAGWAVALVVVVAALAPWVVRNERLLGRPVLTTSLGARLYESACIPLRGGAVKDGPADAPVDLEEVARNDWYLAAAWKAIAGDPLGWLGIAARQAAEIWSPWPLRESDGLPLPPVAGYTSLLPAGALALVGVWTLRRRPAVLVWLLAAPVYVTIVGAVLAGGVEDRLPAAPILAVLGGAGLAAMIARPDVHEQESKAPA